MQSYDVLNDILSDIPSLLYFIAGASVAWFVARHYYIRGIRNKYLVCYKRNLPNADTAKSSHTLVSQVENKYGREYGVVELLLQNEGDSLIELSDIIDAIEILVPGDDLKDCSIASMSRPQIAPNVERTTAGLVVSFKYLDKYDGFTLQLIVSNSAKNEISVKGIVKNSASRFVCRNVPTFVQTSPSAGNPLNMVPGILLSFAAFSAIWVGWYYALVYGVLYLAQLFPALEINALRMIFTALTVALIYVSVRTLWRVMRFMVKSAIEESKIDWFTHTESSLPTKWDRGDR